MQLFAGSETLLIGLRHFGNRASKKRRTSSRIDLTGL